MLAGWNKATNDMPEYIRPLGSTRRIQNAIPYVMIIKNNVRFFFQHKALFFNVYF